MEGLSHCALYKYRLTYTYVHGGFTVQVCMYIPHYMTVHTYYYTMHIKTVHVTCVFLFVCLLPSPRLHACTQPLTVTSPRSPSPSVGLLKKDNITHLQEALSRSGTIAGTRSSQPPPDHRGGGRKGSMESGQPDISVSHGGGLSVVVETGLSVHCGPPFSLLSHPHPLIPTHTHSHTHPHTSTHPCIHTLPPSSPLPHTEDPS